MEFQTIEHNEDPVYNWRRSFLTGLGIKIQDLKQERAAQVKRRIYIGTEIFVVKDLRDDQLEMVARRDLERDTERAIIQRRMDRDREAALQSKRAEQRNAWQRGAGPEDHANVRGKGYY